MIKKDRVYYLDLMKFIGLFSAMLVHHNLSSFYNNLLAFSVPMLVFLSGMLSHPEIQSFRDYISRRCKRIILPTYIFVFTVLLIRYVVCSIFSLQYYSLDELIYTFLLTDNGMGYVWISRVFILIAFMEPLLIKLDSKLSKDLELYVFIVITLWAYHVSYFGIQRMIGSTLFQYTIYQIPYIVIYLIGKRVIRSRFFSQLLIFSSGFYIVLLSSRLDFSPASAKYPPDVQYVAYGVFVSILLYYLISCTSNTLTLYKYKKELAIMSDSSFHIYLCQAFLVIFYSWALRKVHIAVPVYLEIFGIDFSAFVFGILLYQWQKGIK